MAGVEFTSISKSFGSQPVLRDVSISVQSGEFVALVGPSGCGKSTLLRILAGLEEPNRGTVSIGGKIVNNLSPKLRGISMVFQSYALYPHMTVQENLAFPLRMAKLSASEIKKRVVDVAEMLDLSALLERKPGQLSGGQKQRVAMGRAMIRQPQVLLFDEPLSNLDAQLRVRMRTEIAQLHKKINSTIIYVTHDQVEAMTLADRIAILNNGSLEQIGRPMDVFNSPRTQFVASFIGTPQMNFLPVSFFPGSHPPNASQFGFRAENTALARVSSNFMSIGKGRIDLIEPLGSVQHLHVGIGGKSIVCELRDQKAVSRGEETEVFIDTSHILYFTAEGETLGTPT